MSKRSGTLIGVASLLMWFTAVTVYASCPSYNLDDWFERSAAVFVGQAVAQRIVATTADRHETETRFEISSLWKGELKTTLQVRTWACGGTVAMERGETLTCSGDVIFRVGSMYVVFAAGTPLETQACGPTDTVERARTPLKWLSDKPFKNAG